jgi:hypothetical protein
MKEQSILASEAFFATPPAAALKHKGTGNPDKGTKTQMTPCCDTHEEVGFTCRATQASLSLMQERT